MTAAANHLLDVSELARMLDARADSLVRELLPDGRRQGHEWVARCPWHAHKNLGSFSVHIGGAKSGVWKEFGAGDSGDSLDLVALTLFGGDKKRAITWAKRWLGLESGDPAAIERVRRATPSAEALAQKETEEAKERRALAFRLWLAAETKILGTPVDLYLRGRGIPLAEMKRAPRAIRFHPALFNTLTQRKWPAMITMVAAGDGSFAAAHRTWLEIQSDGSVRKAPIGERSKEAKSTLGLFRGASIRLWRGVTGRSLKDVQPGEIVDITEGIEDGLSVAYACPEYRVLAAISIANMAGIVLPDAVDAVRIWRQNDKHPETIKAFQRVVDAHATAGRQVLIPPIPLALKDANDLLCVGNE